MRAVRSSSKLVRNHLPLAEHTHFDQHKTAKAVYDAVVTHYSSLAIAALGCLILPYLFPELSAFDTVDDLTTHLRTSDTRNLAALKAEFLYKNLPPMYITLFFIVTRLPDSLRAVRDHFFALDPIDLTIDLFEKHLLAPETIIVAVGAARGTHRTPFFEGCPPSPLAPSYASVAAVDILGTEEVGDASAPSGKRRSGKGKGGNKGGGGSGGGGGGGAGGGGGGGGGGGSGGRSGGFGGGGGGSGGSGGGGSGGGRGGAVQRGGSGGGQRQQQQRPSETPTPQQLREWFAERGASGGSVRRPYVIRTCDRAGQTCRKFHTQHRCFSHLDVAWRAEFGAEAERPRLLEFLMSGVDIFAFDYDAILAAMYAFNKSAKGDCYLCVQPYPDIEVAALGTCKSALSGTAPAEALQSFMLDSGASRCFFRDTTTDLVTPPCHAFVACTPASLSLIFPSLCLPSRPRLPRPAFLASRGGTAPLLTPPRFPQRLIPCRLSTWTCGAQPSSDDRAASATFRCPSPAPRAVRPGPSCPASALDRGGEFSSDLLRDFCRGEGILQMFTLPSSLQENGVAERRIGLVMEVARTSMIHAAAPHFLWPFAVRYTAHQLSLWPRVSLPETSPTLRWTGNVGDVTVFRGWGSRIFVRDTSADKLSSCAIPCVFLGFPPDAPGWPFYHPTSRRLLPSQDVTFDESVPFYRPPPVDPLPSQGPAPSGVSQVDPLPLAEPVEVTVYSGAAGGSAARGAASWGAGPACAEPGDAKPASAEPGGAEPECAEPGGAETEGAEPGGAESEGAEFGGAEPRGIASAVGAGGPAAEGTGAGGAGATRAGGAGAGDPGDGGAGPGGTRDGHRGVEGTGAGDPGAGGAGAGGAGAEGVGSGGTGAFGAGAGGAGTGGAGAGGAGAGGTGAGGAGAGDHGFGGATAGGA
ncbi:unnamed protein product [Closterium sp. NIES-53]